MTKKKYEARPDHLGSKDQILRDEQPLNVKRRLNFERRVEIPLRDIKKAYLTWEWERLVDLAKMINARYGKAISIQYLSLLARKHGWKEARRSIKAQSSWDIQTASLSDLAREGRNFDLEKSVRGLQSRLVQVIAAQIPAMDPVYLRGMIEVYEHFENLIVKARQPSEPRKVFIAPFSRRQE